MSAKSKTEGNDGGERERNGKLQLLWRTQCLSQVMNYGIMGLLMLIVVMAIMRLAIMQLAIMQLAIMRLAYSEHSTSHQSCIKNQKKKSTMWRNWESNPGPSALDADAC